VFLRPQLEELFFELRELRELCNESDVPSIESVPLVDACGRPGLSP